MSTGSKNEYSTEINNHDENSNNVCNCCNEICSKYDYYYGEMMCIECKEEQEKLQEEELLEYLVEKCLQCEQCGNFVEMDSDEADNWSVDEDTNALCPKCK
jgi:hypothetical protein